MGELLSQLAQAEHTVRSTAQSCSDELYSLVGTTTDATSRTEIVELRRDIHNDRSPRKSRVRTPSVSMWLTARERRQDLRDRIAALYPLAAHREREALAELLGDEHLGSALALVAPEVGREANRYRASIAAGGRIGARARKSERGLLQYVTRAMVRTSALSQFTAAGIAVPDREGIAPDSVRFERATSFVGLDRTMLGYVLGGLHQPAGDDLERAWVGLSPTALHDVEAGTLYFLRRIPSGLHRLAAPVRGAIAGLLDAVTMGPRPFGSVVAHIGTQCACLPEDAANIVAAAVQQGILCTYNQAEDGTATVHAMLTQPASVATTLLEDLQERLPRFGTAPASERSAELVTIQSNLAELSAVACRPAQITVEEDYVLRPLTVATGEWSSQLDDLAATVELLSTFDWLHDVRLMMTGAFTQRFGAGANIRLADHAQFLVDETSRRAAAMNGLYASDDAAAMIGLGTDDGSLGKLHALRRRIIDVTHDHITRAVAAHEPEVRWNADDVVALTAGMPERVRRDPLCYGALVQTWHGRLIFNDGLPGHGMLYSRLLAADQQLGGRAVARLSDRLIQRYTWDGCQVVEDIGLHRLNVNAHPRILPDGLGPDDWFSLRLVHDQDSDALNVEDADGRRLRVLALGTGHPGLLPAPLSVTACLFTGGRLNNHLLNSWHDQSGWDGQDTRELPRMSIGDVVLSRRRWYGGAELAGVARPPGAEHESLVALTEWRGRHDVPEEVVVKTAFEETTRRPTKASDALPGSPRHKPQYVDLTSAVNVRVLPRMLERRTTEERGVDYLEEALPAVVDGRNAAEWVVEIGRSSGGLFEYEGRNA
ncbi:MAG: hypothetical protein L0I24_00095 [Pseudonocardia sp.]|nr:hypothetical protein [Pseudonocardia sp.]